MEKPQKHLAALSKLARELNRENVLWALGGSMLLYCSGIPTEVHDLDLLIAERDIPAAERAMLRLGKKKPEKPNTGFCSRYFGEFVIDGVEVDVIAGFTIVTPEGVRRFPLMETEVSSQMEIGGEEIPLHSLRAWRMYYALMGRTEKVRLLDDFFNQKQE